MSSIYNRQVVRERRSPVAEALQPYKYRKTLPKDVDKNHHFKQQMKVIKEKEKKFKELKEIESKPKGPLFKMKKFEQQESVIKSALKKNDIDSINCCYTIAGHAYNAAECERMIIIN